MTAAAERLDVAAHLRFLAEDAGEATLARGVSRLGALSVAVWRQGAVDFAVPPMDFHLLLMCLGGEHAGVNVCDAMGGRERVVYRRNALFFVPAGHGVRASFTGQVTHLHLMLEPATLTAAAREMGVPGPERLTLRGFHHRRDPRLQALATAARRALGASGPAAALVGDGLALALSALLIEGQGPAAPRLPTAPGRGSPLAPALLSRVVERIEAGLGDTLRMADLAALCGMSPFAFSRAFRAATGEAPHRWVIGRRVARAEAMLREGDAPLADIAYACGFSSQAHMTATFTGRLGVTPGRIRTDALRRRFLRAV